MESKQAEFQLEERSEGRHRLSLLGDWTIHQDCPDFSRLAQSLEDVKPRQVECCCDSLGQWDSALPAFLLQCHNFCESNTIELNLAGLPDGVRQLLDLATAVNTHRRPEEHPKPLLERLDPRRGLVSLWDATEDYLDFVGQVTVALTRVFTRQGNTRRVDFLNFVYQAGPNAFGIITLTSFLVGMILAYLGAAQLAQFGAQIYVADLVTIGMLREMGALMTAVVMAGRTGAAYAAQLGTMQAGEEIDAIVTLGISPIEFLVLPRILALVLIMPLLMVYADVLGILGGAIVAAGMDVSLTQFAQQMKTTFQFNHLAVGLVKSVTFGLLIAMAGCRAGMKCGRSSAAVGDAATNAVVTSIVYLIVADAAWNILFQKMGI